MTEQLWTIVDTVSGDVLANAFVTSPAGQHPKDAGWDWDASRQRAIKLASRPDPATQVFSLAQGAWIDVPAKVEPLLIAQVKAANEALVRGIYSTNFGKQKKYSRKQQETLDYRALSTVVNGMTALLTASALTTAFAALPVAVQRKKFRFAMADAAIRGEPDISAAIGRFESAIDTIEARIADWEAIEQAGIARIKAAATADAKRAAFAAIDWNWRAGA